jgi:hypothetical protein
VSFAAAAHSASVEIKNGFVILYATVNGKDGLYILDSGAPGLVINSKYLASPIKDSKSIHGIHGAIEGTMVANWDFHWNGFGIRGENAYAIDLSYIERAVGDRIDGLAGIDLFSGYYIIIDYAQSNLQLWNKLPDVFRRTAFVEFEVEMLDHVPVISLQHANGTFRFAFDSGSAAHILDNTAVETLNTDVIFLNAIDIVGADQKVVRTSKIEASGLSSKGIMLPPTNFVLTDLSAMKAATKTDIDGILGQPLFKGRFILIDRERKFLRLSQIMDKI